MTLRLLDSNSKDFSRFLDALTRRRGANGGAVDRDVAAIIAAVQKRGDRAVIEFTRKFDGVSLTPARLRVSAGALAAARAALPRAERRALELAARRIAEFHRHTLDKSFSYRDGLGMRLGQLVRPLDRVGIYVPGGMGAYPSSVLMNAIPARVAGVREVVMVTPSAKDGDRPAVLAAAAIAGVDEVYRIGGAQAIAALAYGTASIGAVDKIVGPGNAWVQAAKRMVYGVIDIDKMAGPSEVLVIADARAHPEWVAADLIAQAEHGSGEESAVLITASRALALKVSAALERALGDLPRADAVRRVLARRGAAVVVKNLEEAFVLANRIAPEHLELDIANPGRWLKEVKAAGAVFVGARSSAPLGDYLAGPNHVLPTGGSARFASPLGAYDFVKRTSIIEASAGALRALGPEVARLARMEGFEGHARAMEMRLAPAGSNGTRGKSANGRRANGAGPESKVRRQRATKSETSEKTNG
ncbi:MAG TPA: histidinol dehydrogenase [Candidatus Binataceae bacterium]|jgi:histidinol dehydrogenase|nr:histidinol dehydrogenase [Candidatus Binataceae bacterium]